MILPELDGGDRCGKQMPNDCTTGWMERAELKVILRFPSVRLTVNSTAGGKTGKLLVCGPR